MSIALALWWHRRLGHRQYPQMNGASEPGVWCRCVPPMWWRRAGCWWIGEIEWTWFPSI